MPGTMMTMSELLVCVLFVFSQNISHENKDTLSYVYIVRPRFSCDMLRPFTVVSVGAPGGVAQIGLSRLSSSEPTICLESSLEDQHFALKIHQDMLQAFLLGRMENRELQSSPSGVLFSPSFTTAMTRRNLRCVSVCPTSVSLLP